MKGTKKIYSIIKTMTDRNGLLKQYEVLKNYWEEAKARDFYRRYVFAHDCVNHYSENESDIHNPYTGVHTKICIVETEV